VCIICHACLLEDSFRVKRYKGVLREKSFGFRAEGEVCDDDISAFREEELCKAEVDAKAGSVDNSYLSFHVYCYCTSGECEKKRRKIGSKEGCSAQCF
jgi:hypothetical protein